MGAHDSRLSHLSQLSSPAGEPVVQSLAWPAIAPMEPGNVYLIGAERQEDADAICRAILAPLPLDDKAMLFALDREPADVLSGMEDHQGPGELQLYRMDTPPGSPFRALSTLPRTLARRLAPAPGLLVLNAPVSAWDGISEAGLARWLDACGAMLRKTGCALLITVVGPQLAAFGARVRPMNNRLSGLAALRRDGDVAYYQIRHWRSRQGVTVARRFQLQTAADGGYAALTPCEFSRPQENTDSDIYLAMADALEPTAGRPFTALFDDAQSLYSRALAARAATVLFSLDKSADIAQLAGYLHALRRARGGDLKLVVREMAPCLRYRDEQNLLACGANLIVPHGTGSTRLLTQLASIQGQTYARPLTPDPVALLAQSHRPRHRGIFGPSEFTRHLEEILDAGGPDEPQGVLVVLDPVPALSAQQAIAQCQLRRYGDLACTYRNQVFLYLFECHADIAPYALRQVFRLPVHRLFGDWRTHTEDADIRKQIQPLRSTTEGDGAGVRSLFTAGHREQEPRMSPIRQSLLN